MQSHLVICMAGKGSRFHNAGFDVPKYLLPWEDGTVLGAVLRGLCRIASFSSIRLVANERDREFQESIVRTLEESGFGRASLRFTGDTRGQAETALIGIDGVPDDHVLFVHNADTVLTAATPLNISEIFSRCEIYIDVFPSSNKNYSYVEYRNQIVQALREKMQVSRFASTGLYAFKRVGMYREIFRNSSPSVISGEMYVSQIINLMLQAGRKASSNSNGLMNVPVVLGTPQEYFSERERLFGPHIDS